MLPMLNYMSQREYLIKKGKAMLNVIKAIDWAITNKVDIVLKCRWKESSLTLEIAPY
ncbi:hypothetical protein KHA80_11660 [Anaerobacillus sp. HL2]|nr:hypothetical protein KHA80_11660 [Anaerobacillus sp. HL2]